MPNALLVVLVLLPAILAYLLKSNAALAFLALCGGFAAIALSGSDIEQLVGKTKITSLTSNNVDLLQLIPALCAGALVAAVAAPMFNQALNTNFSDLQTWKNLQNVQSYSVGVGLIVSLLLIWSSGFMHAKSHSKKHK
jgi:CDP-diglyceride synthetase